MDFSETIAVSIEGQGHKNLEIVLSVTTQPCSA